MLKVSKDRRTTAENGAFVGYVAICLANDMKDAGNPAYRIAEAFGAELAVKHGKMPEGVFIPEADFHAVYDGVIASLKELSAKVLMERAAERQSGNAKH